MTDEPSGSRIKKTLTSAEVKELADWFRESHEAGWRPAIRTRSREDALRAKLNHIYGTTPDGRRWPPTGGGRVD